MKKYTCTNCDDKTDNKYIRAMIKAGFAARHLDCRTCGQQGVVEVMKNQKAQAPKTIKVTECKLTKGEKRLDGNLVTYPVSYRYNGGIIVDGKHYSGFDVVAPTVPEGYKLVNIGVGLQLDAQPPYATRLLKKVQA